MKYAGPYWAVARKPVQGKPFPGQGGKHGVVKGQDTGDQKGGKQEYKIQAHVEPESLGIGLGLGDIPDHWTTFPRLWRVSFSPIQMIADERIRSRNPKALPWFQLKLAMNWL